MKEKLYTIPLNDAFHAKDECPFCYIERSVEQNLLDFILGSGSSYMQSDIRGITDKAGFCRTHYKKMFDYGNALGNGWILKTHYEQMSKEFETKKKQFSLPKISFTDKIKKKNGPHNSMALWAKEKQESCYICNELKNTYSRYLDTFFVMYKTDPAFKELFLNSKGFCLTHFGDLCEMADVKLNEKELAEFYPALFHLTETNLTRLHDDVSWLIEKFDYRNNSADWKNSKDAIQRGMQKLKGGYPADSAYKMNK